MNGNTQYEGRVEVYRYPDGWGTVCNDLFEEGSAQVTCRMLGFSGGEPVYAGFGEGTGRIFMDNVACTGSEQDLWECARNEWGQHNCVHSEDAGIRCGM